LGDKSFNSLQLNTQHNVLNPLSFLFGKIRKDFERGSRVWKIIRIGYWYVEAEIEVAT